MIILASCGPATPEPGKWVSKPEEFGNFSFVVSEDSTSLSSIELTLVDWSCGEVPSSLISGYTGGDGVYTIDDNGIEIELNLLVGKNVFESMENFGSTLKIKGTFEGKTKASGSWNFSFKEPQADCSGTWSAEH